MADRGGTIRTEAIATGRLELVPLAVDHADEMAVVLSDPDLHVFIGGAPATPDELRDRYRRMLAGSTEPGVFWCNWVLRVRDTAALAGTVQATIVPGADGPVAEVAWVVGTAWQGRGLATEAAGALVGWLVSRSVRAVVAHVHPAHTASAAVARAVGLTPTDQVHDGEVLWRSVNQ
jgi:RimJ/RimL family protein N-acetyltransferase